MARILFGGGVSAMRGSVGGLTFQNNTSGNIVRSRPHTSRASTPKQTTAHVALGQLLYQWQQITGEQQESWNMYAATWTKINKFGQVKRLSGANWFTAANFMRIQMELSILSSPPAHTLPQPPPEFFMSYDATHLYFNSISVFDYVNNSLILWSCTPTRTNTLSINQIRKQVVIWNAAPANPVDITSLWELATGISWAPTTVFPNANIFYCLQSVSKASGITSAMLCTKNITVTPADDSMLYYL
jgi:hypothetical protein